MQTQIKTWQEAFEKEGLDPNIMPDVSMLEAKDQKTILAAFILPVVVKTLNEGWSPDYNDSNQWKYEPWFKVEATNEKTSGVGLSCVGYDRWHSGTDVGVRLCYKDLETLKYGVKTFLPLYEDLYL